MKAKRGPKPSVSGKTAREQALKAAEIAQERNKNKVEVRLDHRTVILVDPDKI